MLLLKILGVGLLLFLIALAGYSLIALLGTFIPRHRKFSSVRNGVEVFLSSNGHHTDFILPLKNQLFDWSQVIQAQYFNNSSTTSFLGIGWGERAMHLEIVEWSEVTIKMGWNALFRPSPCILHVTSYEQLPNNAKRIFGITISESQYLQLCEFILTYFLPDDPQTAMPIAGAGYTENDIFYEARGTYHAFNTCNTWVNKGLQESGVRTPLWTSIDRGLFYQCKKIR